MAEEAYGLAPFFILGSRGVEPAAGREPTRQEGARRHVIAMTRRVMQMLTLLIGAVSP